MKQNKFDNINDVKQVTDEEIKTVTGGMKIVIDEQPSWLRPLLRLIFKIKG